jgi:2,3-bisphosphoglycerate-independent phosphoglycerate mutase
VAGVSVFIYPGKEHRFVILFRGEGLRDDLTDADPQKEGKEAKGTEALSPEAQGTAEKVNEILKRAAAILRPFHPANTILLRGFSKVPDIPTLSERFKLRLAAIATYPMYRGLARLVGMEILQTGETPKEEVITLARSLGDYDLKDQDCSACLEKERLISVHKMGLQIIMNTQGNILVLGVRWQNTYRHQIPYQQPL